MPLIALSTAIAAGASGVAAIIGIANRKKIKEVHVLVNNRLDAALENIGQLQESLRVSVSKEAEARQKGKDENAV